MADIRTWEKERGMSPTKGQRAKTAKLEKEAERATREVTPRKTNPEDKERSQRRTERETRLAGREQRQEARERRSRVTKPIGKAVSKTTEGTGSSTALGLGVAGVAALFLASGILHKKLGQILEGETTETPTTGGTTPASQAIEGEQETPAPSNVTGPTAAFEHPPTSLPRSPITVGSGILKLHEWEALAKILRPAVNMWTGLEKQVKEHKLSLKEAQKRFAISYPKYASQSNELVKLHGELVKEGLLSK